MNRMHRFAIHAWWLVLLSFTTLTGCGPSSEDIFTACEKVHLSTVQNLLRQNASLVNARDRFGGTPLDQAAFGGHVKIVELLLNSGADVNAAGNHGLTPLHMAVMRAQVNAVRILIAKGAKVDARVDGDTPLHIAAQGFRFTVVQKDWSSQDWAIKEMVEIAKLLIAGGADVNSTSNGGRMPIHEASRYGNKPMVEFLLQSGADANAKDNGGSMPLHYLAASTEEFVSEGSLIEVARVLLANGARLNERDEFGNTPDEEAARAGRSELATLLKESAVSAGR
jgi:ankyrin repeat protein